MALTDRDRALMAGLKRDYPVLYYALYHHRTHKGKPLDFKNNLWMKQVYADDSRFMVFIKSTQNGITEYLTCRDLVRASRKRNVFHVLPNDQILQRYKHERVDRTIENTAEYKKFIIAGSNNVHLLQCKDAGTIAYVASGSASQFTEFAADDIVIDESDRCEQENLAMAPERLSFSDDPAQLWVSNPTIVGYGIDEMFSNTDQMHWHIKCSCGAVTTPDFFKHVIRQVDDGQFMVIDPDWQRPGDPAHMVCDKCGRKWSKNETGVWIPLNPGAQRRGYRLSKLFTARTSIGELVQNYIEAEKDDTKMTRFYNADLGLAFTAPGAKITEDMLDDAVTDWKPGYRPDNGVCVAGIDVGSHNHMVIGHITPGVPGVQIIDMQAVKTPEEVIDILHKYKVRCFVIDAMPETRMSIQIADRAGGFRCFFSKGKKDTVSGNVITTDRTAALDNVKAGLLSGGLRLPVNARSVPDFYAHMTASTRVFDENGNGGEGSYDWKEGSKADHFFLATAYMSMAARILVMAR